VGENLEDERTSRGPGPRLWWAVASGVFVAAAILLLIVFARSRSGVRAMSGSDVLEVPPVGGVVATNLGDGRPVFVLHHEDGTVGVVDAFSTHVPFGIGKLVGWCPSSRTFDDPFHGARWDEYGDYVLGPAPTGLVTYQVSFIPGDHNQLHVDGPIPSLPRGSLTRPFQPAGPFCQSTTRMVLPDVLRDASSSPADVVAAAPGEWMAVRATLLATAGQQARLCAAVADGACVDAATVSGVDVTGLVSALRGPGTTVTVEGPWIAQVRAGALVHLTRVPRAP
jgi:hypothetical protein